MSLKQVKKNESLSVSDIITMFEQGQLNFNPSYQRESSIWPSAKKKLFLFTLLNHEKYYIPDVFVNAQPTKSQFDSEVYDIVDGKQRLSTIIEFVTGKKLVGKNWVDVKSVSRLKLGKDESYYDYLMSENPHMESLLGLSYDKLPKKAQNYILSAKIGFVKFYEYTNKTMVNIFTMLQEGVPLSQGEKLKPLGTSLNLRANEIELEFKDMFAKIGAGKRGAHNQTILQLLAIAVDSNVGTNLDDIRQLISRTKDSKKIRGAVDRVKDFLTYLSKAIDGYSGNLRISRVFNRINTTAYLEVYLENDGFLVDTEVFRSHIDSIIDSPEYKSATARNGKKGRRNEYSNIIRKELYKDMVEV